MSVTKKERKQVRNDRIYAEKVAKNREKMFYGAFNKLAISLKSESNEFSLTDDFKSKIDKNIDKVFKPFIQKSLFNCWRLNINQFTKYFQEVWERNLNAEQIQTVKSKVLEKFLKKYSANKVTSISNSTRKILKDRVDKYTKEGMSHKDMVDKIVEDTKGNIKRTRAKLIAREETSQCISATNHDTALKAKLGYKKWIHRGGGKTNRPNHLEMDGKKIKINEKFNVPGHGKVPATKMRFPKDPENNVAGQIIQCYCSCIYTRK